MAVHAIPAAEADRHQLDETCPCGIRVEPVLRRDMTWREHWIHQPLASDDT